MLKLKFRGYVSKRHVLFIWACVHRCSDLTSPTMSFLRWLVSLSLKTTRIQYDSLKKNNQKTTDSNDILKDDDALMILSRKLFYLVLPCFSLGVKRIPFVSSSQK